MHINWTHTWNGENKKVGWEDRHDTAVTRIPYLLCSHIAHTPGWSRQTTREGNQSCAEITQTAPNLAKFSLV